MKCQKCGKGEAIAYYYEERLCHQCYSETQNPQKIRIKELRSLIERRTKHEHD